MDTHTLTNYTVGPIWPDPPSGTCRLCNERPAQTWFVPLGADANRGGGILSCRLCALREQLAHAEERAAALPGLRAEIAKEGGEAPAPRCASTHHTGCACWEAQRDAKIAELQSALESARAEARNKASEVVGLEGELRAARVQIAAAESSHGRTVREIGAILGIHPSLNMDPNRFLEAVREIAAALKSKGRN